jgi:hypothetical protein
VALRLSTVGRAVLDGKGLAVSEAGGVSVAVFVGVLKGVSLRAGIVNVSVTGERAVFVGGAVPAEVGGIEVAGEAQANEMSIHTIGRMSFRLIA